MEMVQAMNNQVPALLETAGLIHQDLFPIREVARLTGVNPVTLRAWERRYGLIQPTRTQSGHRLYSQADIDDIRRIVGWLERGVAVSKVAGILAQGQALREGACTVNSDSQAQVREALQRFDRGQLDRLFDQVFASHSLDQVFADVFMPVWHDLAAGHRAFGRASEWLFLDQFLRERVLARLQVARIAARRQIMLAPLSAQCHELELLVASLLLTADNLSVMPLAPGQPLDELTLLSERIRPDALVLYANQAPSAELCRRMERLAQGLQCPLLLAGYAADVAQESLAASPVVCLGSEGVVMRRRLERYLAGQLDT